MLFGSVRIDRLGRSRFRNRHLIQVAIKGVASAKDQVAAVVLFHRNQHSLRTNSIHIPVAQRLLNRFTDSLESSAVNHRLSQLAERFGTRKQLGQTHCVPNVSLN